MLKDDRKIKGKPRIIHRPVTLVRTSLRVDVSLVKAWSCGLLDLATPARAAQPLAFGVQNKSNPRIEVLESGLLLPRLWLR